MICINLHKQSFNNRQMLHDCSSSIWIKYAFSFLEANFNKKEDRNIDVKNNDLGWPHFKD